VIKGMPDIRYVCISDLHLGADNSLLTQLGAQTAEVDPTQPSEVLEHLANCLREVVRHNEGSRKPTLILNGDALELALAQDEIALMAFERFMELMFPTSGEPLVDPRIILNPGNHDHHLWETARETQYVEFLEGKRHKKPDRELPRPWHITRMFDPDLVDASLLNAVIHRHAHMASQGVLVGTLYPNLCVLNADESKCVIFSHGHYVEPMYMLMTTLGNFVFPRRKVPKQMWGIETENFAWIDFFWSAMGRSGDIGKDIEQVYDMLQVPAGRRRFVRQLARAEGHRWVPSAPKLGELLGFVLIPFISKALNRFDSLEKKQTGEPLTSDAEKGLRAYIEGPLAMQILEERQQDLAMQSTFIFGHTHKPFSRSMDFAHFAPRTRVYNSGGWVVDTEQTDPAHGGALVLIDEQMNTASLRMYNESASENDYHVKVEAVDSASNPLYGRLATIVDNGKDPWRSFSNVIAGSVERYHENFRKRLNMVR
jgi:UDP-2,3-diacylglucosamine pyrophosphatase LpxH